MQFDNGDIDEGEAEFEFYFANAMNSIYKWAHL